MFDGKCIRHDRPRRSYLKLRPLVSCAATTPNSPGIDAPPLQLRLCILVSMGLVATLARPGGNVTGIAGMTAELSGKCIELIPEMLPAARRVTALAHATD